jgi:hypothetical protein
MYQLLAALGDNNVRASRKRGQWMARCPVHGDKDFAMRIKENDKGGLSINCFACGANGLDVYRHLDLDLSELFGERKELPTNYVPASVRDQYMEERFLVAIFTSDVKKGIKPSSDDAKRMRLAVRRIERLRAKYSALMQAGT